jgi:pyridoxamine 5'-phosphate oxidase
LSASDPFDSSREEDPVGDPLEIVRHWYDEAVAAGLPDPDSMALATADPDGRPSVRFVLLKGIDERGVRFFTNYGSRKARELAVNPRAAVTLYWHPLHRSVRLEGTVERLTPEESDAYFAGRPRGAQLGAWASDQSAVLEDRAVLEARLSEAEARFPETVPRPDGWGGFLLRPTAIELWTGRANRLHDRESFILQPDGSWRAARLAP